MAKAIILKSPREIEILREANRIVAETLQLLREKIAPGITTWQLDKWAEDFALTHDAKPAFKGYRGFPGSLCVSLNEQVVHGIPSRKVKLKDGDIVSIDFGVNYQGYYGDAAITVAVACGCVWVRQVRSRSSGITEKAGKTMCSSSALTAPARGALV